MKKLFTAVLLLTISFAADACAQKATLRLGGGLLTPGSAIGGGAGVDINLPLLPVAIGANVEYFTKSGTKFIPITVVGLIKKSVPKLSVFAGGGAGYAINDLGIVKIKKPVVTGMAGASVGIAPLIGVYGKVQYYRQIVSGAANTYSYTGGVTISLGI
ncbi:MAG: hypothetical protein FJY97_18780 [candidate division Zixibacteria bacterium]|nr:hypothetical protein [candidate division Zixibacteria bacterium]